MKNNIINIRVSAETKKEFQKLCQMESVTMSEKITELVEGFMKTKTSTIKSILIREANQAAMFDILFETPKDAPILLQKRFDELLGFEVKVKNFTFEKESNVASWDVSYMDDSVEKTISCSVIPTGRFIS